MPVNGPKAETAYQLLRGWISDGTYGPGRRLVVDQLVRETGISSIPWREAIRSLAAQGWLEITPNVGARVTVYDTRAYGQTMRVLARLEGYATAAAVMTLTRADLDQARRLNVEMNAALNDLDPVAFTGLNREFHFLFYARCDDPHLLELITAEWDRLDLIRRAAFTLVPGRPAASVIEHDGLLNLIQRSADADLVEAAARQHKLNSLLAVYQHDAANQSVYTDPPSP